MFPNTPVVEVTFNRSLSAKLSRRIHLPAELRADVHEERIICTQAELDNWILSYNRRAGWNQYWLPQRNVVRNADNVEVILRRHKTVGNFILFRVYKQGQES